EECRLRSRISPNRQPIAEARSAPADPGGRTDGLHGFKCRNEEWSRPLEPARRKRNVGAVATACHPKHPAVGTKSWLHLDAPNPHVSNPDRHRGKTLDRFATLAMTDKSTPSCADAA